MTRQSTVLAGGAESRLAVRSLMPTMEQGWVAVSRPETGFDSTDMQIARDERAGTIAALRSERIQIPIILPTASRRVKTGPSNIAKSALELRFKRSLAKRLVDTARHGDGVGEGRSRAKRINGTTAFTLGNV